MGQLDHNYHIDPPWHLPVSALLYSFLNKRTVINGWKTNEHEHFTLQDEFIIPCPKFGTNRIVALMTSNDRLI